MDRVFVISGAGTGIGRAIAQSLSSDANCQLLLIGRRKKPLEETRSLLAKPESHIAAPCDTRDGEALRSLFEEHLTGKPVAGVVANAGVGGENQYGEQDRWDEIIGINLTGTYILVNEALPYLKASQQRTRHIVLMSSILAKLGVGGYSAYCTSKAGMLGLMRSWAQELASQNILVNAICPGWVDTDMAREGIDGFADLVGCSHEEAYKQQMDMVPLGKMSEPPEIGALVRYLVSDEQRSMTGQSLDINNGALMPS